MSKEQLYRCLDCGRANFVKTGPHNCNGTFRKKDLRFEPAGELTGGFQDGEVPPPLLETPKPWQSEVEIVPQAETDLEECSKRILKHHENCLAAFGQHITSAFLAGWELLKAKEALPHGQFMKWREKHLSGIPTTTATRYLAFATSLQPKLSTVDNLSLERLQLTNGDLPEEEKKHLLAAVHEIADGKTLTQMYRDLGVIRDKKPKESHPPKPLSPEEEAKQDYEAALRHWTHILTDINFGLMDGSLMKLKKDEIKAILDGVLPLTEACRNALRSHTKPRKPALRKTPKKR